MIVGAQLGDEGKGKIVDLLALDCDLVCRYQGGPNAGHTIVVGDETYRIRQIPSGIILGKPGGPDSEIELKIGWFIGLLGSAGICAAGVLRQAEQARDRKPPGVL